MMAPATITKNTGVALVIIADENIKTNTKKIKSKIKYGEILKILLFMMYIIPHLNLQKSLDKMLK